MHDDRRNKPNPPKWDSSEPVRGLRPGFSSKPRLSLHHEKTKCWWAVCCLPTPPLHSCPGRPLYFSDPGPKLYLELLNVQSLLALSGPQSGGGGGGGGGGGWESTFQFQPYTGKKPKYYKTEPRNCKGKAGATLPSLGISAQEYWKLRKKPWLWGEYGIPERVPHLWYSLLDFNLRGRTNNTDLHVLFMRVAQRCVMGWGNW